VRGAFVLIVVATRLAVSSDAWACSVPYPRKPADPHRAPTLAYVEVLAAEELSRPPLAEMRWRLHVLRTYKGDELPAEIEVTGQGPGGGLCGGNELPVGMRTGLALPAGPPWRLESYSSRSVEAMEHAALPKPRARGSGRAAVLVARPQGAEQLTAYDERGGLIGFARHTGRPLAACPGSKRILDGGYVMSTPDLRVVIRHRQLRDPAVVRCLSADGHRVAAYLPHRNGFLAQFAVVSDRGTVLRRTDGHAAVLGADRAFLVESRRLITLDYREGRKRVLGSAPARVTQLAVSPRERRVAFLTRWTSRSPARLVVRDLANGRSASRRVSPPGGRGDLHWLGEDRLVHRWTEGERVHTLLLDAGLRRLGRFTTTALTARAFRAGTAYGVDRIGRLVRAGLPDGPLTRLAALPDLGAAQVLPLPDRPRLRLSALTPGYS
jgi:hypothetical protein